MGRKITTIIADKQVLIREGLRSMLEKKVRFSIVAECADKMSLFNSLKIHLPDIVIIDPQYISGFAINDIMLISTISPQSKILIISEITDPDRVKVITEQGISGYLTKTCDIKEIDDAIIAMLKGETTFCNKIVSILISVNEETENCEPTVLSAREIEVIKLIASGYTTKEIAETLYRSFHTISTHRKNIMKKLGVNSATELMMYALNTGLIEKQPTEATQ